jgi:hypothetical protein
MIDFAHLLERMKSWSDAKHTCTQCGMLEPACDCRWGHEEGQNWAPTEESRFIDETIVAFEMLLRFAERACPKCDGCGSLLLKGGVVEADGITKKPARIVCVECKDPNFVPEPSRASLSLKDWILADGDAETVLKALADRSAASKIEAEQLQPFIPRS